MNKIIIYNARAMTNRIKSEVVQEAAADKKFFEGAGFTVLCPVSEEQVKAENKPLQSTHAHMVKYWSRDKQMIRDAHIVLDFSPHLRSVGVAHELGYARYCLWKPIMRIYPEGQLPHKASIEYFEDDAIVDSRVMAVEYILRIHGTFFKRLKWRLKMLNRSFLKWLKFQVQEFK